MSIFLIFNQRFFFYYDGFIYWPTHLIQFAPFCRVWRASSNQVNVCGKFVMVTLKIGANTSNTNSCNQKWMQKCVNVTLKLVQTLLIVAIKIGANTFSCHNQNGCRNAKMSLSKLVRANLIVTFKIKTKFLSIWSQS